MLFPLFGAWQIYKIFKMCSTEKTNIACEFETTWEWVDEVWIFILWMNYYCLKSYAGMSTVFIFEQMWTALRDAVFFQMGALTGWNAGVLLKDDCDIPLHSVETCSNARVVFYFVWQGIFCKPIDPFQERSAFSCTKAILELFASHVSLLLLGACVCEVKSY